MRKFLFALVIGASTFTGAIASADSTVYTSNENRDVDAMYGASWNQANENVQPVALVASAGGRWILPKAETAFESKESYDLGAMYGAARPATAEKSEGSFTQYVAEPIPGGP